MTPQEALNKAIDKAGGIKAVAAHFRIKVPAIYQWREYREGVPANRVLALEELTGISRHDLRPDIFGPTPAPRRKRRAA